MINLRDIWRGYREECRARRDWEYQASRTDVAPDPSWLGRGVVVCAGGERCFTSAWIHLHILRRILACPLPVQVWHFGPSEWKPQFSELMAPLGVEVIDGSVHALGLPEGPGRGFALKCLALFHSRFREVLFLDADNVPVREPSFLFEESLYRQSGALFWPDLGPLRQKNRIWRILGIPPRSGMEWESGQMVIDKEVWIRPLILALYLNRNFPFYYRHLAGDKQTFALASWKSGVHAGVVPHPAILVEADRTQSMLNQHAPDGSLLFQHRTQADWTLHGHNPLIPGFVWENECRQLLEDLRGRWDGHLHPDPEPCTPMSDHHLGIRGPMRGPVWFHAVRRGAGRVMLELLPDGTIGAGGGWDGERWRILAGPHGPELEIETHGEVLVRLAKDPSGIWTGRKSFAERMEIRLIPAMPPLEAG